MTDPRARAAAELTQCQSGRDGECFDARCPQLVEYRSTCPLWKDEGDD